MKKENLQIAILTIAIGAGAVTYASNSRSVIFCYNMGNWNAYRDTDSVSVVQKTDCSSRSGSCFLCDSRSCRFGFTLSYWNLITL